MSGPPEGQLEDLESLRRAYCPPLDEALFFAITSDYNLSQTSDVAELKGALDSLKDGAVIEQELELLPERETHDAHAGGNDSLKRGTDSSRKSQSERQSTTEEDGVMSITTGLSGLDHTDRESEGDNHSHLGYGETGQELENLSTDQKLEWLQHMFPDVSEDKIRQVLTRCDEDFDSTTDELLNISFLNGDGPHEQAPEPLVNKGVDAFLVTDEDDRTRRKNKKNRKQKNRRENDDSPYMSDTGMSSGVATPSSSTSNVWKSLPQDVEFIASRTSLKPKLITSVYHANGAHLAPTIRALVTKESAIYNRDPDQVEDLIQWQMEELKAEFEQVPNPLVYGSLMLANKIPSAAKELLEVMVTSKEEPVMLGKVKGLASYAPVDLSDDDTVNKRRVVPGVPTVQVGSGLYTTSHLANAHGLSATAAFQQASALHRRGKSDRLMGGAAAYYASVGHENVKAAKALQAAAADAHVAAQSSSNVLDLHGVNVADAVRIARQGLETWWENLGDRKLAVGGVGDGYRIVTGVGRHSADGIGRIGPAVSKMLVREGWNVQIDRGELVVRGKKRQR